MVRKEDSAEFKRVWDEVIIDVLEQRIGGLTDESEQVYDEDDEKWLHVQNLDFLSKNLFSKIMEAGTEIGDAFFEFVEDSKESLAETIKDFILKLSMEELTRYVSKSPRWKGTLTNIKKSEEWWNTLKNAGAVTTSAPGTQALMNQKVIAPKEEEEEYPIVPDVKDFWRD
jgi:hypothetical protein